MLLVFVVALCGVRIVGVCLAISRIRWEDVGFVWHNYCETLGDGASGPSRER